MGATGANAPVNFQKTPVAPVDFPQNLNGQNENWTLFNWIRAIRK